ncbi:SDR family oxidoreductase [Deinococcus sp.]|uniref:SDR family oxidoreductase n=1 Tax=Deinococcus sp. TaxID=47478 RepID=UPI0025DC8401|nr:SDR family oxidoreductase [Deinococcus sp.]
MQLTDNTILITGGGSGIGRALAEQFHARGNQVIIAGRRKSLLDEVTAAHPGMHSAVLDIEDAGAIKAFAAQLARDFPALNTVIHNAGIMRAENIQSGNLDDAEATIATNLLGPIRLSAALLPTLMAQPRAAVLTVSSGLAFMTLALTPTYCATKAAIHAYSQALRFQLRETGVQVIELVPPAVQTELMGPAQASNPQYMPLSEYISETMHLLETQPDAAEILVERVKPLRFAEANGGYDAFFQQLNGERH